MIRKMVHSILNIKAARSYVPYQDLENKQMLHGLMSEPDLFIDHIRRYTNSLTTQMVFGFRTTGIDDPKLKRLFEVPVSPAVYTVHNADSNLDRGLKNSVRLREHLLLS